jgi:hypothetical protein
MKVWIFTLALALGVFGCTQTSRYNSVAATCRTYTVALSTFSALLDAGKVGPSAVAKVDATIPPARAVCEGEAPSTDEVAIQKVSDAIIAILKAQTEVK